jgi:hypothetical protein
MSKKAVAVNNDAVNCKSCVVAKLIWPPHIRPDKMTRKPMRPIKTEMVVVSVELLSPPDIRFGIYL